MIPYRLLKTEGFTLIELIITIIIVGVLASIAMPRFAFVIEKMRSAEALKILEALRNAQEIYKVENGSYTTVLSDLDVTIPQPENFEVPTLASSNPIVSIERDTAVTEYVYTLTIDNNGTIKCSGTTPAEICSKLGCTGGAGSDECN